MTEPITPMTGFADTSEETANDQICEQTMTPDEIQALREKHRPIYDRVHLYDCIHCYDFFPCDTIRVLNAWENEKNARPRKPTVEDEDDPNYCDHAYCLKCGEEM